MTGQTKSNRNVALYAGIGWMTAWQGLQFALTREAVLTSFLAALIAIKACLSPGEPKGADDPPAEVQVVNASSDPLPTTDETK